MTPTWGDAALEMHDTLRGRRILVVEDEYLIAADLRRSLGAYGVDVVSPVGSLRTGLALAGRDDLDAAVLDINLAGDASFPIADVLADNDVPFVFLTGYDAWAIPETYAGIPTVTKPHANIAVLAALESLPRPGARA